jgi:hypothetical protein
MTTVSFTPPRALAAEGARCGLVTCLWCGATLLLDPDSEMNVLVMHAEWHAQAG